MFNHAKSLIEKVGVKEISKDENPIYEYYRFVLNNDYYLHFVFNKPFLFFGWGKFEIGYKGNLFPVNNIIQKFKMKKYIKCFIKKHAKEVLCWNEKE